MVTAEIEEMLDAAFADYEAGRLAEAEAACTELLARAPRHPTALHLGGILAGLIGKPTLAISRLREAAAAAPGSADILGDLGHLLRSTGELGEAIVVCEAAVSADINSLAANNNLGEAYLADRRPAEALAAFERACRISPEFGPARYNLGVALQSLGRDTEAIEAYRQALTLDPKLAEAHMRLGNIARGQGRIGDMVASYRRAAEMQPHSALGQVSRAIVDYEAGDLVAAETELRQAIRIDPARAEAYSLLGGILSSRGKFDEAIASFRRAVELDPAMAVAWHGMVLARRVTESNGALIEEMERLLTKGGLADRDTAMLHFALGKALDDLGEYRRAIAHFDAGNQIEATRLRRIRKPFDHAAHERAIRAVIATATPDFFDRTRPLAAESELPILIVGMPRSGTTLVEQILSSHPKVAGADELMFWNDHGDAQRQLFAGTLSPDAAAQLAADYVALLRRIGGEAARVTDKMPQNYLMLGIVHAIFPRARIIHCRRHPVDTCLSIYFTLFGMQRDFVYDRAGIVAAYRQYLELMAHWRRVLPPDRLLEVDYEAVTEERERETRRIIAFCGLDWDDRCLASERNERAIKTASLWQARQKIYRSSVERWRRYEPWLGEFAQLLVT